jgi:hypothetical protein
VDVVREPALRAPSPSVAVASGRRRDEPRNARKQWRGGFSLLSRGTAAGVVDVTRVVVVARIRARVLAPSAERRSGRRRIQTRRSVD